MAALLERVSVGEAIPPLASREMERSNTDASVESVLDRLGELYDDRFGGFGAEPKQPPWEALHFLSARYGLSGDRSLLEMVDRTLQGMWHGIYDLRAQGFFRYSVSRDWKVPHYEKMLVTNASLLTAYLEGYLLTRRSVFRDAAAGIVDYLLTTLKDPDTGLFYASQDADEPYYQMPWRDRDAATYRRPSTVTFYAGWNALAADALIQASHILGKAGLLRSGTAVLERLWRECWDHSDGLSRRAGEEVGGTPFLSDQVWFLKAWLTLYQSTGEAEHLGRAIEVAQTVLRVFGAPEGGCYDGPPPQSFEASLLPREQPVQENGGWAEALAVLAELTGDEGYQQQASATLDVFRGVVPGKSYLGDRSSRRMEEDEEALFLPAGSSWGRAQDIVSNGPVKMLLIGDSSAPDYRRLHRAALSTGAPHRVVQPLDSRRDAEKIGALGFPLHGGAALYACMGERCLAPVTTPRALRQAVRSRPWAST